MKHHEHRLDLFWLNDMRFLAAIAIIVVHVSQPYFDQESTLHPLSWWVANAYLSATMWGVPVFVMISGALLLSPEREYASLQDFYKRRLNRLFLPVFFWSLLYLVLLYVKNRSLGLPTDANYFTISIIKGHPYYHMWYLYMVWGLYLFTPFLRKIVKHSTRMELLVLSLLLMLLSVVASHYTDAHNQVFFLLMFPFFLGYYLVGYLISVTDFYLSLPRFLVVLATLLGIIIIGERHFPGHFMYNFSITMIAFSMILMYMVKNNHHTIPLSHSLRKKLASFSLGAYLIHPAVLAVIRKMNYFGIPMEEYLYVTIPVLVCIVTAISLLIAYTLSKLPFFHKVI